MSRNSSRPNMPERPQEGMNLHDWATVASVILLAMLIVVGLISVIMINGRLTAIEESIKANSRVSDSQASRSEDDFKAYQNDVSKSLIRLSGLIESSDKGRDSSITDLKIQLQNIGQDLKKMKEMISQPINSKETSALLSELSNQAQPAKIPPPPTQLQPLLDKNSTLRSDDK